MSIQINFILLLIPSCIVLLGKWARKLDENNILCSACDKKVPCERGITSLLQHSKGDKHKNNYKVKYEAKQLHLEIKTVSTNSEIGISNNANESTLFQLCGNKDDAVNAELMWTMHTALHNLLLISFM